MNILMINPAHPSTPHISATRAWKFALELSKLDHRVVLLCNARSPEQITDGAGLNAHDWSSPYILAPSMLVERSFGTFAIIRKLTTMVSLLIHGGHQWRWKNSAIAAVECNLKRFKPDVVWATFGCLESVFAAKKIAKWNNVPWVLDLKDNWQLYVPSGLHRMVARRICGYSAITANADFTRRTAPLLKTDHFRIIYSGVDDVFFMPAPAEYADNLKVIIVGGLYADTNASSALRGLRIYLDGRQAENKPLFKVIYIGSDSERFLKLADSHGLKEHAESLGYVSIERMVSECKTATANIYICFNQTFHHKLLELIACNRPIIAYGGDIEEARSLAVHADGDLHEPKSAEELAECLRSLTNKPERPEQQTLSIQKYTWEAQAAQLAHVLSEVVAHG